MLFFSALNRYDNFKWILIGCHRSFYTVHTVSFSVKIRLEFWCSWVRGIFVKDHSYNENLAKSGPLVFIIPNFIPLCACSKKLGSWTPTSSTSHVLPLFISSDIYNSSQIEMDLCIYSRKKIVFIVSGKLYLQKFVFMILFICFEQIEKTNFQPFADQNEPLWNTPSENRDFEIECISYQPQSYCKRQLTSMTVGGQKQQPEAVLKGLLVIAVLMNIRNRPINESISA